MLKSKIEWCDSTWNPVTGCYNSCPYCYARRIANRLKGCDIFPSGKVQGSRKIFDLAERLTVTNKDGKTRNAAYPFGFAPTLHEYRLEDPGTKGFGKTVFVCSMSDLFGEWVPDEWIKKVFDACKDAEGHRYLFLTKNPWRYVQLHDKGLLPEVENFWYGSTADTPKADIFKSAKHNTFVSMEPILEPFKYPDSAGALRDDWIIMGAETGSRADKAMPERSWVEPYVEFCKKHDIPIFMKNSMKAVWGESLIQEFPWEEEMKDAPRKEKPDVAHKKWLKEEVK